MKPKSKLLSLLLTICLVVGLMPTAAFAAGTDTGKAIQLVDSGTAANIGGGQADNIYFGTYQQSSDGSGGYNTDPIKWRVLENADGQLFLLSDQNLDVFQYHTDYESVTWEKSTMRSWLNGYGASHNTGDSGGIDYTDDNFINTAFSEKEQKAIADTTVVNDDNPTYGTEGGENTNDKIFLLSIAEAQNSSYFADDNSRIATNTAYAKEQGAHTYSSTGAGDWWLRSPGYGDIDAALVDGDGCLYRLGFSVGNIDVCVRPAFNLNLNSVLFTSAAVDGKSSAVDGNLRKVATYDGNEWKLTLLDEARNSFEISNATITDTITFSYSGAATGTNEYISAVVVDNGAITHYGRILQPRSTSGTASFTIPDGVTLSDTVKLYVFNEQYNSDKMTDYASQLKEISSSTDDTTDPTLSNGSATRDSETTATVKFTSSEAGSYYYEVVNSGENQPTIDTDGTGTTCGTTEQTISLTNLSDTSAKDIYIVVKDAAGNVSQPLTIQIPAYTSTTFTVTVNVDPSDGGTASANYTTAAPNTEITLTATPSTGYHFKEWQVTEGTASIGNDNKFTMPAENVTVKAVFEAHSFTQENTDSEYLASSATCTQAATYYYSCSCGAKDTNNTFTSGEALGHTLGAAWQHDNGSTHWKECENCGAKVDETAHDYENGVCKVCNAVQPTYAISASPETLNFGSETEGYADAPAAQTVTIKNMGKQSVTVNLPTSTNYIITAGEGFTNDTATLAPNGTAAFTVQPKTGLGAGDYSETLTISGSNGTNANVQLSFAVTETAPVTYTLTVNLNGGSGSTTDGEYAEGAVINIDAGSRSNYRFDRWTSSNGGSFASASSASTTFTMPAADTTITANWRYIGGGTTPSIPTKTPSQQAVDKIEDAKDGDTVEIALRTGQTTLDKEVFETLAGRDVTLEVSVPGGAVWTVHGTDIPENAALVDIGMGVSMGTSTIPVDLINAVTGEVGTVQLTLQHDGPFGFTMTLTAPVGAENTGLWANLYHYDEDAGRMAYRSSAVVGADGNASLPFDHAGQYALVLDDKSHELPFTDLEDGAWYLDAVGYAYRHDLMGGYGGTSLFGPDDGLLREQAAQVVWNLMGEGDGSRPAAPHADVAQGRWYSPAVNWAVDAKVMDGYDADTFGVGDALTREQFAAVVAKAAGADVSAADAASLDVFSDAEDVSGWAVQTMAWAVETGIINGVEGEDGSRSLDATRALTRAEMAAMVMNAVDKGVLALPSKQNA